MVEYKLPCLQKLPAEDLEEKQIDFRDEREDKTMGRKIVIRTKEQKKGEFVYVRRKKVLFQFEET